jgi:DNA replicative helicase MCM subunit Mcm2 (Cdc46/Mcm family)
MSRFDLFFVILDECNAAMDEAIARSVLQVELVNSHMDTFTASLFMH